MLRAVRLAAKLGVAIEPKTAAPIPSLAPLMQNVPPARLFDEMQKLLLSGHAVETLQEPARARPVARPAAAARRDPRAAARPAVHRRWRSPTPTSACAKATRRLARLPVRDAAVARGARDVERGEGARRASRCRRCSTRWTRCSSAQAEQHRDPAPLRGDDQGDLVAAAALRAARRRSGRSGCSSIRAFAPPTTSSRCAARAARCPQALVDWWTRFQDADARGARGDAEARRGAEEAAPAARPRPQARSDARGDADDAAAPATPTQEPRAD